MELEGSYELTKFTQNQTLFEKVTQPRIQKRTLVGCLSDFCSLEQIDAMLSENDKRFVSILSRRWYLRKWMPYGNVSDSEYVLLSEESLPENVDAAFHDKSTSLDYIFKVKKSDS